MTKLVRAAKEMRPGEERDRVRERAGRMARRTVAVLEQEATWLEDKREVNREGKRKLTEEVDVELTTGAA